MRKYALGFMFSPDKKSVVLIQKTKPAWQKGKWNGVGGKVEEGELYADTMAREFEEETGVVTVPSDWSRFATMNGIDWAVACFVCFDERYVNVQTKTEEKIKIADVYRTLYIEAGVSNGVLIPNLAWLIPMALSEEAVTAEIFHPTQK